MGWAFLLGYPACELTYAIEKDKKTVCLLSPPVHQDRGEHL